MPTLIPAGRVAWTLTRSSARGAVHFYGTLDTHDRRFEFELPIEAVPGLRRALDALLDADPDAFPRAIDTRVELRRRAAR